MKVLFLVLTMITFSQTSLAVGHTPFERGDGALSEAHGRIIQIRPACPKTPGRPSCMAIGSVVTIEITLKGCLDRLGGYFTSLSTIGPRNILNLAAINIHNEGSTRAYCVKLPTEIVEVHVPLNGRIELMNSEFIGSFRN